MHSTLKSNLLTASLVIWLASAASTKNSIKIAESWLVEQIQENSDTVDYQKYTKLADEILQLNNFPSIDIIKQGNQKIEVKTQDGISDMTSYDMRLLVHWRSGIEITFVSEPNRYHRWAVRWSCLIINLATIQLDYQNIKNSWKIEDLCSFEKYLTGIIVQEIFHLENPEWTESESEMVSFNILWGAYIYYRLPRIYKKLLDERKNISGNDDAYSQMYKRYVCAIKEIAKDDANIQNKLTYLETWKDELLNTLNKKRTYLNQQKDKWLLTEREVIDKFSDYAEIRFLEDLSFLTESDMINIGKEFQKLTNMND